MWEQPWSRPTRIENVSQSDFGPGDSMTPEKLLSRRKRALNNCVGNSNPPDFYSSDAFHRILWPSIVTMASRDIRAKRQTYGMAYMTYQIWFRRPVPEEASYYRSWRAFSPPFIRRNNCYDWRRHSHIPTSTRLHPRLAKRVWTTSTLTSHWPPVPFSWFVSITSD